MPTRIQGNSNNQRQENHQTIKHNLNLLAMNTRKKYIKPETKIIHISQESPLMSGSSGEDSGIDKNLHKEVVDPGEQLAKPSSSFSFFNDDFDSEGWED